jgi:hypothetical protein
MTKTLKQTWAEIGKMFDLQKEPRETKPPAPPPKKKKVKKHDKNTSKTL